MKYVIARGYFFDRQGRQVRKGLPLLPFAYLVYFAVKNHSVPFTQFLLQTPYE